MLHTNLLNPLYMLFSYLAGGEVKAQRGQESWSRSHSFNLEQTPTLCFCHSHSVPLCWSLVGWRGESRAPAPWLSLRCKPKLLLPAKASSAPPLLWLGMAGEPYTLLPELLVFQASCHLLILQPATSRFACVRLALGICPQAPDLIV